MAIERRITSLLQHAKGGDRDAADEIARHFWEAARRAAKRHLASCCRQLEGDSDIANAALRSALSELTKPKTTFRTRDDFEGLIVTIVRKKSTSSMRHALAEKRRGPEQAERKELASRSGEKEASGTPVNLAMAAELGKWVENFLNQEPNPIKRSVGLMGILDELEPQEILQALRSSKGHVPSLRFVQKHLQITKERIADGLRENYAEFVPPKKEKLEAPEDEEKSAGKKARTKGATKRGRGK